MKAKDVVMIAKVDEKIEKIISLFQNLRFEIEQRKFDRVFLKTLKTLNREIRKRKLDVDKELYEEMYNDVFDILSDVGIWYSAKTMLRRGFPKIVVNDVLACYFESDMRITWELEGEEKCR